MRIVVNCPTLKLNTDATKGKSVPEKNNAEGDYPEIVKCQNRMVVVY